MNRASVFVSVLLVVIVCWTQQSYGYVVITNGTGNGVLCGNKTCAPEANCTVNETCKCYVEPYVNGHGCLKCYTNLQWGTYLVNDPVLATWDQDHANFEVPCRYQLTSLSTNLYLSGTLNGICTAQIRPFNAKDRGKYFVWGFDTAIRIVFFDGTIWKFSVRKSGLAEDGIYTFMINATNGLYNVDGHFDNDQFVLVEPTTGLELAQCYVDHDYNMAVINISYCGICIRFRPYDIILRRQQKMTPGLMVVVDKFNAPNFLNDPKSMALIPDGNINAVLLADLPVNISKMASIIAYYLETSPQIPQNNNTNCIEAGNVYASCNITEAIKAFTNCLWILTSPKFVRCYDTSFFGEKIMGLFSLCLDHYCNGELQCATIQSELSMADCSGHDPTNSMLSTFTTSCPT